MNKPFLLPSTKGPAAAAATRTTKQIPRRKRRSAMRREEFMAYSTALKDMGSQLKSTVVEADQLHNKIRSLQKNFKSFISRIEGRQRRSSIKNNWCFS